MAEFDTDYGINFHGARLIFKFRIQIKGVTYNCAITQETLNDCLETVDTKAQAEQNLNENLDIVGAAANRLVEIGAVGDDGMYVLKTDFCRSWLSP